MRQRLKKKKKAHCLPAWNFVENTHWRDSWIKTDFCVQCLKSSLPPATNRASTRNFILAVSPQIPFNLWHFYTFHTVTQQKSLETEPLTSLDAWVELSERDKVFWSSVFFMFFFLNVSVELRVFNFITTCCSSHKDTKNLTAYLLQRPLFWFPLKCCTLM